MELSNAENHIKAFCEQVRKRLTRFDIADKRLALHALQVKARVTEDRVVIKGVVSVDTEADLATIERTSA